MKRTLKKALSVILSLALTVACLTCAFSGFTASAVISMPNKMVKMVAPSADGGDSNPRSIIIKTQAAKSGHTYRISMYKSSNLSVNYLYYRNSSWTKPGTSLDFSVSSGLSSCEFTLGGVVDGQTRLEIRFNIGGTGKTFYASGIKLVDVTSGSDTNLLNDPTVSGNFENWGYGMLNSDQLGSGGQTVYTADSTDMGTNGGLVDFDADTMGVFAPPEENNSFPDNQLKLTAPNWSTVENPYMMTYRVGSLTSGHTYRLSMFQNGLLDVKYKLSADGSDWSEPYGMDSVSNGAYYYYQFVPTETHAEIILVVGEAGETAYVSGIKLVDFTARSDTNLINDPTDSGHFGGWGIVHLQKMLKITPEHTGDAISFRQQELTAGHSYKLKMLQNGITGIIPRERVNWSYVNTPAVAGAEGDYTTYTFTCAGDRTRLLFTTEAAGTSGYMADIKLYDITSGTEVGIDFTAMKLIVGSTTYSNWLVDRTDPQSYSPDILNDAIDDIGYIELLDFDAEDLGMADCGYANTVTNISTYAVIDDFNEFDFDAVNFKTYSLTLDDKIGVNFFVDLTNLPAEDRAAAYMTFEITNGTEKTAAYNSEFLSRTGGYYGFTCPISSVAMAERITPTFHYTYGGESKTYVSSSYSVKDYIDYVNKNAEDFDENVVALVKAIGNYGYYAQQYFLTKKTFTPLAATYSVAYTGENYNDTKSAVSSHSLIEINGLSGITNGTAPGNFRYNLNLDSTTSILIRFVTGSVNFTSILMGGNDYADRKNAFTESDCTLYLLHLPISKLGDKITVSGTANGNSFTVPISGLSYIYGILDKDEGVSEESKNMVAALYDYYDAAIAYINHIPIDGYLTLGYI